MSQRGRVVVARAVKQNTLTVQSHQIVTCVDLRWGGGGGTFEPSRKKMKYSPQAVEVKSGSIYSVKTSRKDDRCFVTTDGTLWFCSVENCKLARSVQHNSSRLANFTCTHVDQVKSNYQQVSPVAVLSQSKFG